MSNDTDTIENAEEALSPETERYEEAYRATRVVLSEAIEVLGILENHQTDPSMRDQIELKRLQLETRRFQLAQANIAFYNGKSTMHPPSTEFVSQIVALSEKSVELTVEKATADAMFKLATSALTKFAKIQNIRP